jgi:deoxyribodipyrimidine photolyase-related protein
MPMTYTKNTVRENNQFMQNRQEITIVYPHQLFRISDTDAIQPGRPVILIEESLFFTHMKFHKKKILLHRASMRAYADYLRQNGYDVDYLSVVDYASTQEVLDAIGRRYTPKIVHIVHPSDYLLKKRLREWKKDIPVSITWHQSPLFVTSRADLEEFLAGKDNVRMADFYRQQRRRMNILVDDQGNPKGGQWSFDEDNREPLPTDVNLPGMPANNRSHYVSEARTYVQDNFNDHYGQLDNFFYPVTRRQALQWLDDFFVDRFAKFGPYEDAFAKDSNSYLWHSVLTPFLNIGLVTPEEVVEKALKFAEKNDVPINSLEGFIRQIIGWREFMHGLYLFHGSNIRNSNFFAHDTSLPETFWRAETNLPPVDRVIQKVQDTGYAHHIERLMVLANIMTLLEIDPDDVYGWFMEMFIDSYDWVMVPNVYSMGVFADGGLMATKPYVSSSNYLTKMSNWSRDKDNKDHWSYRWDSLYWQFLKQNKDYFKSNPRLARLTSHLDRMSNEKLEGYMNTADKIKRKTQKDTSRFDSKKRSRILNTPD